MENIKISKNITKKTDEKHVELTLEGELTLPNAKELKKEIQKNITGFDSITIISRDVKQADITFIQIIESLKRHLADKGKKVSVNIEYPYDVKTLLINAGFEVTNKK